MSIYCFRTWIVAAGFLTIILTFAVGCGKQPLPGPQPHPVHGKVMYRGQPAKGFRVAFHPVAEQGTLKFAPSAVTDEKGEFWLHSYSAKDGAPPGEYAVTFQWPRRVDIGDEADVATEVDQLKGRYSNPGKSLFKAKVTEGNNELAPFELQ